MNQRRIMVVAGAVGALTIVVSAVFAAPALGQTAAPSPARPAVPVAGTSCTAAARACVDLAARKAWLINNGVVVRGPVRIATGGPGEETPPGQGFRVYRKDKNFASTESRLPNGQPVPMPYSVFFEDGGIAFHAGDPHKASAGCVHLNLTDAKTFYNFLRIGDRVQVTDELDHRHSDSHDNGATDHHDEHQENDEHQGK